MEQTQLSDYTRVEVDHGDAHPVTIETRASINDDHGDLSTTILTDDEARTLTLWLVKQLGDDEAAQTVQSVL